MQRRSFALARQILLDERFQNSHAPANGAEGDNRQHRDDNELAQHEAERQDVGPRDLRPPATNIGTDVLAGEVVNAHPNRAGNHEPERGPEQHGAQEIRSALVGTLQPVEFAPGR